MLLGALLLGCSGEDEPDATATSGVAASASPAATVTAVPEVTATATVTPSPAPSPTPRPRPEANPFPADLQAEAEDLLSQIAAARGVADPQPVDMFLLTREQARKFYGGEDMQAARPTPTPGPRPLDARQELYELLGLVPEVVEGSGTPTANEQALDDLISIITGFYDPAYNAFYMIETINGGIYGPLARSTIVHELTHALQYQEVDLDRVAKERGGGSDERTALLSVIEGDAVNSEIEILGYSTRSTLRQPSCFEIPPRRNPATSYAIERELDVWYEDGLCFVQAIKPQLAGGIQDLFKKLPATMEQVLHPEKYLAGETAKPVDPPALTETLGEGWRLLAPGDFGEFGLQNILLNGLPDDHARVQEAAAGWGGDAWNLYVAGDARLAHIETVWDTVEDASQFFEALAGSLDALGFVKTGDGATSAFSKDGVVWSLALDDDGVTVLVSNDENAMSRAEGALELR